jgi:hypothetical protein
MRSPRENLSEAMSVSESCEATGCGFLGEGTPLEDLQELRRHGASTLGADTCEAAIQPINKKKSPEGLLG